MDDFEDNSNNSDHWAHKYSNWEQDCIDYVESSPDVESQIEDEKGGNAHKLWFSFQNAACCIAQLYKDHEQHVSLWVPFQNAASSVTALYKDCIESQRKFIEMGFQGGMQRRNKEVLAWAKKRKRHIRREDLIAFLSGRSVPSSYAHHHYHTHHRSSWTAPKQRLMLPNHDSGYVASGGRTPPHGIALARLTLTEDLDPASRDNIETAASCRTQEGDLETFREALALSDDKGDFDVINIEERTSLPVNSLFYLKQMSISIRDRFQRAARDGYLDVLKEATRKDCNLPDEDGMTPTLWAAFSGNLDALRTLVGRGGDLSKCDFHGNTALHWAASNGHINCVSFLVSFGINLWALDNDYHTAKDVAAINNREEVVKFLDNVIAKQSALNTKTVQKLKEKAILEAEKRIKAFQKLQKKAAKKAEKEEKQIEKERKRSIANDNSQNRNQTAIYSSISKESRNNHASLKFSDIVNTNLTGTTNKIKVLGGVSKKVLLRKQQSDSLSNDFKVRDIISDDGTKSVKSLTGIRRDNEILYVPKYEDSLQDENSNNYRIHMKDVFGDQTSKLNKGLLYRAVSEPDFSFKDSSQIDIVNSVPESSIFERPGFGSVSFRGHYTSDSLFYNQTKDNYNSTDESSTSQIDSIGSAGSLAQRNNSNPSWETHENGNNKNSKIIPVILFLYANGLSEYVNMFKKEKIDLDALMLLNDDDLKSLGLPLGPRRKVLLAIQQRKAAFESPGDFKDTKL